MILVNAYIILAITFQCVDEVWNLDNPRRVPKDEYILCNWNKEDFYPTKIDNRWILKEYKEDDGPFKRKAREKYWNERK